MNYKETMLIFSDSHVGAEDLMFGGLRRFEALANFISKHRPDVIVQLGDFVTYDSLSTHNDGKRLTLEGQRFVKELKAAKEAYDTIMRGIVDAKNKDRRDKKKLYNPRLIWMYGNHEDRLYRFIDTNPEMEGLPDTSVYWLTPKQDGWEEYDYRSMATCWDFLITHAPMNGMNQPLSSKYITRVALDNYNNSLIFGHTHKFGVASIGRTCLYNTNTRLVSINAGCFFDIGTNMPPYADGSSASRDWWSGIVLVHNSGAFDYDIQQVSLSVLEEKYL